MDAETIDPLYTDAWAEPQNAEPRKRLREGLQHGFPACVEFQPGDMTRYCFLITPLRQRTTVSNDGREPELQDAGTSIAAVCDLNGLLPRAVMVSNKVQVHPGYLLDKMKGANPCTVHALAATIEALWTDPGALQ